MCQKVEKNALYFVKFSVQKLISELEAVTLSDYTDDGHSGT